MASARSFATTLERFSKLFKHDLGNVIGVIHVPALPGNVHRWCEFYKPPVFLILGKAYYVFPEIGF